MITNERVMKWEGPQKKEISENQGRGFKTSRERKNNNKDSDVGYEEDRCIGESSGVGFLFLKIER